MKRELHIVKKMRKKMAGKYKRLCFQYEQCLYHTNYKSFLKSNHVPIIIFHTLKVFPSFVYASHYIYHRIEYQSGKKNIIRLNKYFSIPLCERVFTTMTKKYTHHTYHGSFVFM